MTAERRKILQLILVIGILAAGIRLGLILYHRHQDKLPAKPRQEAQLNPDYYVVTKKLHAYDLASAREITKQPAWVKEGFRYSYYPYQAGQHRADLKHEAGTLGPIEKMQFSDVVMTPTPGDPSTRQMLAIFRKDGQDFAVPIGAEQAGNYQINVDEMFFLQDPRELYKHWPADVWNSIGNHEVKPGMNEIQASFALGMGVPEPGQAEEKTVNYPNGGNPLKITYRDGRAVDVQPGKPGSRT